MNPNLILTPRHPETGRAQTEARASLFTLLAITVALGAILNAIINQLGAPNPAHWRWWVWLGGLIAGGLILIYLGIRHDDRRIGQVETEIELLLPYLLTPRGKVSLGERRSYFVTRTAQQAWQAAWGEAGMQLPEAEGAFTQRITAEHLELVRYLLATGIARYGRERDPRAARYSWLRLEVPQTTWPWESLPPSLAGNRFAQAVGRARPAALRLPLDAQLLAAPEGHDLLRITWRWRRWLPWGPGGELRLRWLAPLSEAHREDKRYELLTARIRAQHPESQCRVVLTRLVVEVETRWNFLNPVARFRDWTLNLAHRLQQQLDYDAWYEYLLQRTILDLDWKIGWMEKGAEPSLAARLRRLDERLARLEEHLWPTESPSGQADGAWLSGPPK